MSFLSKLFGGKPSFMDLKSQDEIDDYLFKQFGLRYKGDDTWGRRGQEEAQFASEFSTPEISLQLIKAVAQALARRGGGFNQICILACSTDIICNSTPPTYMKTALKLDDMAELVAAIGAKKVGVRECRKGCWVMNLP